MHGIVTVPPNHCPMQLIYTNDSHLLIWLVECQLSTCARLDCGAPDAPTLHVSTDCTRDGVPRWTKICAQRPSSQKLHVRHNKFDSPFVLQWECITLRIDANFVIKVADFGLSEDVYLKNYFRQGEKKGVKLPIKWMARESLHEGIFTEKTDVVTILFVVLLSYLFKHCCVHASENVCVCVRARVCFVCLLYVCVQMFMCTFLHAGHIYIFTQYCKYGNQTACAGKTRQMS